MKPEPNGERVVIRHGAKAHRVVGYRGMNVLTWCGMELSQTRPALTRDKACRSCTRAVRKWNATLGGVVF